MMVLKQREFIKD